MLWTGEKLEKDETKAAILHTDMMEIIREIKKNLLDKAEDLVHKFHSVRPLAEQMEGDTLPFLLSISTSPSRSDLRVVSQAGGQHSSSDRRGSTSRRAPQTTAVGASAGGGDGTAAAEPVRRAQRQVLSVRLQNNHNVCYINSLALLWAWAATFNNDLDHMAGSAATALRAIITSKGLLDLLELLPWRRFFQEWQNIRLQHDVQEWCTHLFGQVMPQFMRGSWCAKLLSLDLRDSSNTFAPILMTPPSHLQECTLQTVVDQWSAQDAIHTIRVYPDRLSLELTGWVGGITGTPAGLQKKNV